MKVVVRRSLLSWERGGFGQLTYTRGLTRVGNEMNRLLRQGAVRRGERQFHVQITPLGLRLDGDQFIRSPHLPLARRLWEVGAQSIVVSLQAGEREEDLNFKRVFRGLLYRTQQALEDDPVLHFAWADLPRQERMKKAIEQYRLKTRAGQSVFGLPWSASPDRLAFLGDSLFANTRAFTLFPEQRFSLAGFLTDALLSSEPPPHFPTYGRPFPVDFCSVIREGGIWQMLFSYLPPMLQWFPPMAGVGVPTPSSRSAVFAAPAASYEDACCEPTQIGKDRTASTYLRHMPRSLVEQLTHWLAQKGSGPQVVFVWLVNDFMTFFGKGFVAGNTPPLGELSDHVHKALRKIHGADSGAHVVFLTIPDIPTLILKPVYRDEEWGDYQRGKGIRSLRNGTPVPWGSMTLPAIRNLMRHRRDKGYHEADVIFPEEMVRVYEAIYAFNDFLRTLPDKDSRVSVIDINRFLADAAQEGLTVQAGSEKPRNVSGEGLWTEDGEHAAPVLQVLTADHILSCLNTGFKTTFPAVTPERLAEVLHYQRQAFPALNVVQRGRRDRVNQLAVYSCRAGGVSFFLPFRHARRVLAAFGSLLTWRVTSFLQRDLFLRMKHFRSLL